MISSALIAVPSVGVLPADQAVISSAAIAVPRVVLVIVNIPFAILAVPAAVTLGILRAV